MRIHLSSKDIEIWRDYIWMQKFHKPNLHVCGAYFGSVVMYSDEMGM